MKWIWIALACLASCRAPGASEAALEGRVAALEKGNSELVEALNAVQDQVEELVADFKLSRIYLGHEPIVFPPQIDGSVLSLQHVMSLDLVRIDRGSTHGVKRGFIFEIYRGAQYKGRVRVETVEEDRCTAVVLKTFEDRAIRPGDSVSTRI